MADDQDTPNTPAIISCADAKAAGLKRYFTGKPCKYGHIAERKIDNGRCLICLAGYLAGYYLQNRERMVETKAEWKKANRASIAEKRKKYQKENRHRTQARSCNREAQKRGGVGSFTEVDIRRIYTEQKGICPYCETDLNGVYHIDHRMPLAKGGSNCPENLQVLCSRCSFKKGDRDPDEFMRSLDFLLLGFLL